MSMHEGLRLAVLYSLGCPEIRHLNAEGVLFAALSSSGDFQRHVFFVQRIIQQIDPFAFYQLIGRANGRSDFFAPDIVRAHWLSGSLLRELSLNDIKLLRIHGMIPSAINGPEVMLIKLQNLIGGLPHHNFVVFSLIKRAKQSGQFPPNFWLDFNNCLVRVGQVISVNSNLIVVRTKALVQRDGQFCLEEREETIHSAFVSEVKTGNYVSYHLGRAREVLNETEAAALELITQQAFAFSQKGRQ